MENNLLDNINVIFNIDNFVLNNKNFINPEISFHKK